MATRKTLAEAQALKERFEQDHPGLVFVIDKTEGESQMYPGAIEAQGLQDQVVRWEDNGRGVQYPVIRYEEYEIHELVICESCGKEFRNKDIGNSSFCFECREAQFKARDPRSDGEVQADTAAWMARSQAMEAWNE